MLLKINCKYNDQEAWCINKNVKRSLFGIGAKCCNLYNNKKCKYQEKCIESKFEIYLS